MPTFTLTSPTLLAGQYFEVRYRILPLGAWVYIGAKTNAPFSIAGLPPGQYVLEAAFFEGSPAALCDWREIYFKITEDDEECLCIIDPAASIIEQNRNTYIQVSYTIPNPEPACGWIIRIVAKDGSHTLDMPYSNLPPSPINILLPYEHHHCYDVFIIKDCCGEEGEGQFICWQDEVCEEIPPCSPVVLNSSSLQFVAGAFYLEFDLIHPVPSINSLTVSYFQANAVISGTADSGTYIDTSGSNTLYVSVNPNMMVWVGVISYAGTITDGCGGLLYFDLSISV